MELKRKLPWLLTGKSLLAVGSIAMVALALVTYSATITINFSPFFVQGSTSMSLTMSTSSGTRWFPDGPTGTGTTNPNGTIVPSTTAQTLNYTFATQGTGAGYVQIGTSTAAKTTDFQSFRIQVLTYNGTTTKWVNATMYTTSTFTTKLTNGLDGTSTANSAFLHVSATQGLTFYLFQITYVLVGTPADTSATVTFTETPSLN